MESDGANTPTPQEYFEAQPKQVSRLVFIPIPTKHLHTGQGSRMGNPNADVP